MSHVCARRLLCHKIAISNRVILWRIQSKLFEDKIVVGEGNSRQKSNFHTKRSLQLSANLSKMSSRKSFEGTKDRYEGITVDSTSEQCDPSAFPEILKGSLDFWHNTGIRAVWFKVALADSAWVPILAQNGFRFHHAQASYVMMVSWLPSSEVCNIPQYASTMIGVGAIVMNNRQQILVVSEKYRLFPHWKLPGGYVEPGEDITNAAEREVLEETSVRAKFNQMVCFRHTHNFTFGCSDMYFIIALTPEPGQEVLKKCDREIDAVEWMDVKEYLNHPHVHATNRFFVQKYLEHEASRVSLTYHEDSHPLLKKPYRVYRLDLSKLKLDDTQQKVPETNKL